MNRFIASVPVICVMLPRALPAVASRSAEGQDRAAPLPRGDGPDVVASGPASEPAPADASHHAYADGLVLIHRVLTRNIATIETFAREKPDMKPEHFGRFVDTYVRFLGLHHTGEDDYIFPALRRHTAGRTSDAAFIDAREAEHRQVHVALAALASANGRYRSGVNSALNEIATIAGDLGAMLPPHLIVEESGLSAAHLADMIPGAELMRVSEAMQARDEDEGGSDVLMLLGHSLTADEQRTLLAGLPWFVRRVLMRGIWASGWRPLRPFCFNDELVI